MSTIKKISSIELNNINRTRKNKDSIKEFANAIRNGFKDSMSIGSNTDGGYTVPEDIQTKIEELRESKFSLKDLVTVEPVATLKGERIYKKRTQQKGFAMISEGEKIGEKETPQFEKVQYEIKKYGGYFPVTNELLEDASDKEIVSALVNWISDESRVTANKIILDTINTIEKTTLNDIDDFKKVINVILSSIYENIVIVTNDDGFQYLDTLKDSKGNYLLQPVITKPSQYILFNRKMKVIPNIDMPSNTETEGKRAIPFIIGDLKEGIIFFDRKKTTLISSPVASVEGINAFEQDLTLFRAIEREDCTIRDNKAFVNGQIIIDDTIQ